MSLRPNGLTEIPAETSRGCQDGVPQPMPGDARARCAWPAVHDEQFAELFPAQGRPAWSPGSSWYQSVRMPPGLVALCTSYVSVRVSSRDSSNSSSNASHAP